MAASSALRRLVTRVLVAVPAVVILVSGLLERRDLPNRLATHWSSSNEVNGTSSTTVLFVVTFAIASAVAILGIVLGTDLEEPVSARQGLFLGGVFSGGAAAVWLFATGVALTSSGRGEPSVGAWPLVFFAFAYGLVPMACTIRVADRPGEGLLE